MSCACAKLDREDCIWECSITGDRCMFYIPSAKKCAEVYGEGPLANKKSEVSSAKRNN